MGPPVRGGVLDPELPPSTSAEGGRGPPGPRRRDPHRLWRSHTRPDEAQVEL